MRVARLERISDLNPPLGYPGGVCHTKRRIEDNIRNPKLKRQLVRIVQEGQAIPDSYTHNIYDLEFERVGDKTFKRMKITTHAQFRMDQRGVTIGDLKTYFNLFGRYLRQNYNKRSRVIEQIKERIFMGQRLKWRAEALGDLIVVFEVEGSMVNVVTVYYAGEKDPSHEACPL
jgi:hypothetical protein